MRGEALFVMSAFIFCNGVSPCNAHTGRQPACLPDVKKLDFPKNGESADIAREQRIRESAIQAITHSTAVAKINRALKGKTTPDASELYKPGDLIDYHRPTATKDEHGGWNGLYPVKVNEPERGSVVGKQGDRDVRVRYPDARLSLLMDAIFAMDCGFDNDAMDAILEYISRLPAGKPLEAFHRHILRHSQTVQSTPTCK